MAPATAGKRFFTAVEKHSAAPSTGCGRPDRQLGPSRCCAALFAAVQNARRSFREDRELDGLLVPR